jgi:type I restriction enzyme R subunit
MAMYGQGKTRGKVAILEINATINQACAAITLNQNIYNSYIFFYLSHNYEEIRKLSNTGNQENLNGNIIKSISVPLPPLPEQKAIALTLSDTDALIAACDRAITKKRNIKQGMMQQLLTGKMRSPGFSGEWEVKKLGEIGEVKGGKRLPKGKLLSKIPTPYPYIKVSDMFYGGVSSENIEYVPAEVFPSIKNYRIYKDDLFISVAGTLGIVGKIPDSLKEVYSLLRYGVKIKAEVGENTQTIELINWKEPLENDFAIAEEVTVKGENTKRPDIVLYINGIALGVLELKRSTVSVSEGIRQNLDNQKSLFIQPFFETSEKYYLTWKEDSYSDKTLLNRHLLQICNKERFLELIHNFIVFDLGIKKICRFHQYFGVKAAQTHLRRRDGGIIWHSQGSGKSLTMVWLAKWIQENIIDARVLIITDREELDGQIQGDFLGVNENIYLTKSGKDLIDTLNDAKHWLLCSLIHKFGKKKQPDYDNYIAQLKHSLPSNFRAKGDIYVFIDECHRTQSGKLHKAMKELMPNAVLVGFTGTPLLKKDKEQNSTEVFGDYIHTYKFNEAVSDKVVLDLRYEARNVDQNITSPGRIDQWFEAKTKGLTDYAKTKLKQRWGTMQKVLSSKSRLEKIVADIILDFETKDRLSNGRGNAMLVSGSIYEACKYYELFQNAGFPKCAIVTSYDGSSQSIKGESTGEDKPTEKIEQYEIYQKMLKGKAAESFEQEVKQQFIHEPAKMKLLIVVDKLLTGFDAPSATYLYIDKTMRDHGLFQAICRVNRLDGDDKEYGYIIDYKDLFKSLEKSVTDYTRDAFDNYDTEDIDGLLSDRLQKGAERLEESRESIKALCEPVEPPQDTHAQNGNLYLVKVIIFKENATY